MKNNDEFYVSYLEGSLGSKTKRTLKRFAILTAVLIGIASIVFSISQNRFKNSTFELSSDTKITGVFHESPYPMLRVEVAPNSYKSILLLGFGKFSANPYLQKIKQEIPDLNGRTLSIEGNLIYYNGKTLIQITSDEKVILEKNTVTELPSKQMLGSATLYGEIVDPKCYFGVMKPGKGKIHRSCAVRCISGGIPPVLATTDQNNIAQYFILTDLQGTPIDEEVLPFVGKPSEITGEVEKIEDWHLLKIDVENINVMQQESMIY